MINTRSQKRKKDPKMKNYAEEKRLWKIVQKWKKSLKLKPIQKWRKEKNYEEKLAIKVNEKRNKNEELFKNTTNRNRKIILKMKLLFIKNFTEIENSSKTEKDPRIKNLPKKKKLRKIVHNWK